MPDRGTLILEGSMWAQNPYSLVSWYDTSKQISARIFGELDELTVNVIVIIVLLDQFAIPQRGHN